MSGPVLKLRKEKMYLNNKLNQLITYIVRYMQKYQKKMTVKKIIYNNNKPVEYKLDINVNNTFTSTTSYELLCCKL